MAEDIVIADTVCQLVISLDCEILTTDNPNQERKQEDRRIILSIRIVGRRSDCYLL